MSSKNIILTIIIVVLLAGSGVVLFRGFGGKTTTTTQAPSADVEKNQKTLQTLLPYGKDLNFTPVESRKNVLSPYPYAVTTESDFGVDTNGLVKNISSNEASNPNKFTGQ